MTAVLEDIKEFVIQKWGTLNTVASPGKLPEGHSPNSQNVWVDEKPGSVVTSHGIFELGTIPSNSPITFCFSYYNSNDGTQALLVSDGQTVWSTTDFVNFTEIALGYAQNFQVRARVIRDKVWFTNGENNVKTWDGTSLVTLDGTGGAPNVPIGKYIEYHDEKVWIYGIEADPSNAAFSELTDSSGTEITPDDADAWPTDNRLQIAEGDGDQGTGLFLYRGYLFFSKQFSIWRLIGSDKYTYGRVKTRATTGTRFAESIQIRDNLVEFIGVDGFYVFDGEETKRVSDIIDPANPEQGTFAFGNLQQPLLNNNSINISDTSEWDDSVAEVNVSTSGDQLTLVPCDDTYAEFAAGNASDNIDIEEDQGSIQLERGTTGTSAESHSTNQACRVRTFIANPIGIAGNLVDENTSTVFGVDGGVGGQVTAIIVIDLDEFRTITNVRLNSITTFLGGNLAVYANTDSNTYTLPSSGTVTLPASFVQQGTITVPAASSGLVTSLQFSPIQASQIALSFVIDSFTLADVNVYAAAYELTGKFISKTIDYTQAPNSFGSLSATVDLNGETANFFTQSSADNVVWGPETAVTNGNLITSSLQRYLRWGVNMASASGQATPVVSKVVVGGLYISDIHDTGGSLFAWNDLQAHQNQLGQTTQIYFRAGVDSAGVNAASWTAISPGAVPNTLIINRYIQIKFELSTDNPDLLPYFTDYAVNWIVTDASGINTLQNAASFVWLNRYWLSAATLGSDHNDIVIVRGKSTAGSPWHQKDFPILSFCRFRDFFVGGSSEDGTIYRMEYGYSKDGEALDSYFETGDLSSSGFMMQVLEIDVTADRLGPYDLNIGVSVDGGLNWTEKTMDLTRESGEALSYTKKFNVNFRTDSFRVRVRTNMADQPFAVDEVRVYYRILPMRGTIVSG